MILAGLLAAIVLVAAGTIGGWVGAAYACLYAIATIPGWSVGRALFGRHPAAWIGGAVIGYALTSFALWVPIVLGVAWWLPFALSWLVVVVVAWLIARRVSGPAVQLPTWGRDASVALAVVLLLTVAVSWIPLKRVGETDAAGNRRYRAYFTADFVWHEALAAELSRFDSPPRNPYLASQPLHYYWAYYLLPAVVTGTSTSARRPPPTETYLAVDALCNGLMFLSAIFLAAWTALPRAIPVAAATALTLLAASAEGLYAAVDLWRRARPLDALRYLNIDAITAWNFQGLSIDGLPRSIWYNPQHSMACALGLIALVLLTRSASAMTLPAAAGAGLALGLAFPMSPFPAGAFTLIYGVAVVWKAASEPRALVRAVSVQVIPVVAVGLALAWCVANGIFEGAGGALVIGLSRAARRNVFTVLSLAMGPLIVPGVIGFIVLAIRRFPQSHRPAIIGVCVALGLYFFVTLSLEPIWIGWRAGQVFLVTVPALIAVCIAATTDRLGRAAAIVLVSVLFAVGLPTTLIDAYNAQDVTNTAEGPGFKWTVVLSRGERQALEWIAMHTPPDALVQMSIAPRGRETWSLIPSWGRRRMAAGLPISLLRTPDYDEPAALADRMYATDDADDALRIARQLKVNFIFVGQVEREAFTAGVQRFHDRPDLFALVFMNSDAAVYQVR